MSLSGEAPPMLMPERSLRSSLEALLTGTSAQRLFAVEDVVRPTYEAFAKNSRGKVPTQAIHSIVRSYFMEEHGWRITGFEFSSTSSIQLGEALVLKEKAPLFIKAFKDMQAADHGLSLSDSVAMVAAIEHLILEESLAYLRGAYNLNQLLIDEALNETSLANVLTSYMIIFRQGSRRNLTDIHAHSVYKAHAQKHVEDWESLVQLCQDSVAKVRQPGRSYSFETVSEIVTDLALKYGHWQNSECKEIKNRLVELAPDAQGRVPYEAFHAEPAHPHFKFAETIEYLRNVSALDESNASNPKVLLANYIAAPSNCIGSSRYYSVCCLSECELLVNELEERVQVSEVPLEKLLDAISHISSSTVTAPRTLSEDLVRGAAAIVDHHWGFVPLHSGEFKQWLHYAFPNECPYPTRYEKAVEDSEHDAEDRWLGHSRVPMWQISAEGDLVSV